MTDIVQPHVPEFDRLETQMVREAVRVCGELYIEEIGRKSAQDYGRDRIKQNQFIADGWTFPTTVSLHLLGTKANLEATWKRLRDYPSLMDAMLSTTVKLRGYYSVRDWQLLLISLGRGLEALRKGTHSVMDEVATAPFVSQPKGDELLEDNIWAVTVILLSYMPLMSMPKTLQAIMTAPQVTADKAGSVA